MAASGRAGQCMINPFYVPREQPPKRLPPLTRAKRQKCPKPGIARRRRRCFRTTATAPQQDHSSGLFHSISTTPVGGFRGFLQRLAAQKRACEQRLFHKLRPHAASISGLFHCRAAGLTQARLVPLQADRNSAHVGDFPRAQTVYVRRTGPTLLRGADGKC